MNNINSISRLFRYLFAVLLILLPVITGLFWIYFEQIPTDILANSLPFHPSFAVEGPPVLHGLQYITVNPLIKFLAFIISMLPVGLVMLALKKMISLFANYEHGMIFTQKNVKIYKDLGSLLFAVVLSRFVYDLVISFVLTINNPPGSKVIACSLGSYDIATIIVSGIILVISWVMQEGFKISEEQAHTI